MSHPPADASHEPSVGLSESAAASWGPTRMRAGISADGFHEACEFISRNHPMVVAMVDATYPLSECTRMGQQYSEVERTKRIHNIWGSMLNIPIDAKAAERCLVRDLVAGRDAADRDGGLPPASE